MTFPPEAHAPTLVQLADKRAALAELMGNAPVDSGADATPRKTEKDVISSINQCFKSQFPLAELVDTH
jgi:hypothetical protein